MSAGPHHHHQHHRHTPPHPHPLLPSPINQHTTKQVALVQFLEGNDGFREAPMTLDDEGHMAKKVRRG